MIDLSHIIEPLRHLAVPIDSLTLDPHNAREHSDEGLAELARIMQTLGQDQAVVVQRNGMIVRKGNGRVRAARSLGWTHIAAAVVDETDAMSVYRAITDNRSSERSRWNPDNLVDAFDFLSDVGMEIDDVGFDSVFVLQIMAGQETMLRDVDLIEVSNEPEETGDLEKAKTPSPTSGPNVSPNIASVAQAKTEAPSVSADAIQRANVVFDSAEDYATWIEFTREMKTLYPSLLTTGARLVQFIKDR